MMEMRKGTVQEVKVEVTAKRRCMRWVKMVVERKDQLRELVKMMKMSGEDE